MDIKTNQSTNLRPEGDRVLDAPLVEINLERFIDTIKDEKTWKNSDRNSITVYKTDGMRIVLIGMHEGAVMTKHLAPGVISVHVLEGSVNFITDERTVELSKGRVATLHKGIPHAVAALTKSVFLLTIAG